MTYTDTPPIAGTYFYKIISKKGDESNIVSATTTVDNLYGKTKETYVDTSLSSLTTYFYKVYTQGGA